MCVCVRMHIELCMHAGVRRSLTYLHITCLLANAHAYARTLAHITHYTFFGHA